MGRGAPLTWRQRLKFARRYLIDKLLAAPAMWMLLHLPMCWVRFFLYRIAEPVTWRSTRQLSERHLLLAFGDEWNADKRSQVARQVAHNFIAGVDEMLTALRDGPGFLDARLDDANAGAAFDSMQAAGPTGFIGISGHLGNWELFGNWLQRFSDGRLGAVIAKRMTNPWLGARVQDLRLRLGMETYYRDESPRKPLRMLKEGRAVATVPDQDVKYLAGIFIDFFGMPAYTPIGPARLALAAGVPLICGALMRKPEGGWEILVGEPIHPDPERPREAELERLTRAWSDQLEVWIRKYPEQWAWFHERWRTTPERLAQRGRGQRGAGQS